MKQQLNRKSKCLTQVSDPVKCKETVTCHHHLAPTGRQRHDFDFLPNKPDFGQLKNHICISFLILKRFLLQATFFGDGVLSLACGKSSPAQVNYEKIHFVAYRRPFCSIQNHVYNIVLGLFAHHRNSWRNSTT